jgi:hypothetical protein
MDPTRSDPIPELIHPLPEGTRSRPIRYRRFLTRYRGSYISSRCGTDPIRSDTGVCTSSSGRDPIMSDPIPAFFSRGSSAGKHGEKCTGVGALRGSTEESALKIEATLDSNTKNMCLDSLRGSSVKIGTIQRRLAWPLRKDDTHKSRSVIIFSCLGKKLFLGNWNHYFTLTKKVYFSNGFSKTQANTSVRVGKLVGLGVVE